MDRRRQLPDDDYADDNVMEVAARDYSMARWDSDDGGTGYDMLGVEYWQLLWARHIVSPGPLED